MWSHTDTLSSGVLMFPDSIMQYVPCKEHPIIFSGIFYHQSGLHRYRNLFRKPDAFNVSFWKISIAPWPEHAFGFWERKKQLFLILFINTLIVPSENEDDLIVKWPLYSHKRKPGSPILLLTSTGRGLTCKEDNVGCFPGHGNIIQPGFLLSSYTMVFKLSCVLQMCNGQLPRSQLPLEKYWHTCTD